MLRSRVILQTITTLQELPAQDALIKPGCSIIFSVSAASVLGVKLNTAPVETFGLVIADYGDLSGGTINTLYPLADAVPYRHLVPGDAFLARIKDGEEIAVADLLTYAANGEFAEAGSGETIVAMATEDCDMSSSSGGDADGFCRAVVL